MNHSIFLNFSYSLWLLKPLALPSSDLRLAEALALTPPKSHCTAFSGRLLSATSSSPAKRQDDGYICTCLRLSVCFSFILNKLKPTYSNAMGWIAHDLQKLMPLCGLEINPHMPAKKHCTVCWLPTWVSHTWGKCASVRNRFWKLRTVSLTSSSKTKSRSELGMLPLYYTTFKK